MKFSGTGYQIYPKLFNKEEINLAKLELEEICRSIRANKKTWENVCLMSVLKEHRNPDVNIQDFKDEPFIIGDLPGLSEALRKLILNETLWAIAGEILESNQLVYHFSNVTRKPAFIGPNMSWHRDYPNEGICPADSRHFFRVLVPLEEMDLENGCTQVIPESHRISDETAKEKKKDFDIGKAVPLEAGPGDAIAIHSKLVHGGNVNRSPRDRNLIVIQFGIRTDAHLYWNEELFTGLTREEISANPSLYTMGTSRFP